MIVALYQCPSPGGDLQLGLATINKALTAAAGANVDMLVMPEIFLPGYNAATSTPPEGWSSVQDQISTLCRTHGVGLTVGLAEYAEDTVFNSAYAFDNVGQILAKFRKVQLFGPAENALYTPGDRYVVFDFKGTKFGLLICYDVEFPEHTRALARAGAEAVLVPTANMMPFVNVNQVTVPGRAVESGLTIVYANYCGSEGDLDYVGLSAICGPDGYALACKGTGPGLCVAELPNGWSEHGIPLSTQLEDLREVRDPE